MGALLHSIIRHILLSIGLFCVLSTPAAAELTVLTSIDAPANFIDGGKVVGTNVDLAREILKRIGSEAEIKIQPWARVFESALHKSNIMVLTAGKTPQREAQGFHFIGPIMTRHHAIYTRNGKNSGIKNVGDLRKRYLPVGGLRKDWRALFLEDQEIRMDLSNDIRQLIKKLHNGRYDMIVGSDIETPAQLYENDLPNDYLDVLIPIAEASSYIMFSKRTDPALLEQVRQAFQEIKQTDFGHRTAEKYSNRFNSPLIFTPAKGFHRPANPQQ